MLAGIKSRNSDFAGGRVPASSLAPAIGAADSGTGKTEAKTSYPEPRSRILKPGFSGGRVPLSSLAPAVEATNVGGEGRNPKPRTRKLVPELRNLDFAGGRVPASSLAPAVGATDGGTNKTKLETPFPNPGSRILYEKTFNQKTFWR